MEIVNRCPNCGSSIGFCEYYCVKCGARVGLLHCPRCDKALVAREGRFCGECGLEVEDFRQKQNEALKRKMEEREAEEKEDALRRRAIELLRTQKNLRYFTDRILLASIIVIVLSSAMIFYAHAFWFGFRNGPPGLEFVLLTSLSWLTHLAASFLACFRTIEAIKESKIRRKMNELKLDGN